MISLPSDHLSIDQVYLSRRTIDCLLPPPKVRTFDWICENVRTKEGLPINPIDFPWVEGICDEWDNPARNTLWLQFAARTGKSTLGMSLLMSGIANNPSTGMVGTATETLLKQTLVDKLWPMFERCPATRKWCPPKHRRGKTGISLLHCQIYGAWSGSATTLADKDPRFSWAFEIDKWTTDSSTEADSLELFLERGIEIPGRRRVCESTPAVSTTSRVNKGLRRSTNCRWHVPCPHCGGYQQLIRGSWDKAKNEFVKAEGGIIWDRRAGQHSDPTTAYKTARYLCKHCNKEIGDADRRPMVRRGIWVPEGCWIDKGGRLNGSPVNDGPDAGFQLSRIYASTFTFGDYARHWIEAQDSIEAVRNHVNSWDGEVWEPFRSDLSWSDVAERLSCDWLELGVVPADGIFITVGVDVQVDHWVYHVVAWRHSSVGYVIDYGVGHSWEEITEIIRCGYKHADGGAPLVPSMTFVDARDGNRTDEVKDYCRSQNRESGPWVFPSMGSGSIAEMSGKPFRKVPLDAENQVIKSNRKRAKLQEFTLIVIHTSMWEQWATNCIYIRRPGEPRSIAYPSSAKQDKDLFEQLTNVAPDPKDKEAGEAIKKYIRIDMTIPKDFRDALRYARVAAEVYTNGAWDRVAKRRRVPHVVAKKPSAPQESQSSNTWIRKPRNERFLRRK